MSHPHTRAQRRHQRRVVIRRRLHLNQQWWRGCQCGDLVEEARRDWTRRRPGYEGFLASGLCRWCWCYTRHGSFIGQMARHQERDWRRERDWDFDGVVRRDYRAGGGRRYNPYGRSMNRVFALDQALTEWGDLFSEVPPMLDLLAHDEDEDDEESPEPIPPLHAYRVQSLATFIVAAHSEEEALATVEGSAGCTLDNIVTFEGLADDPDDVTDAVTMTDYSVTDRRRRDHALNCETCDYGRRLPDEAEPADHG